MSRHRILTALVLILGLVAGGSAADLITGTAAGPVVGGSGGSSFTGGTLTSDTTAAAGFCFVVGTNGGKICQKTEGTPDQSGLFTGTLSNAWIIAEAADYAFDFAHAAETDPSLFVHSHNQSTAQWVQITHNGSDAVIQSGTGFVRIIPGVAVPASGASTPTIYAQGSSTTGYASGSGFTSQVIGGTASESLLASAKTFLSNLPVGWGTPSSGTLLTSINLNTTQTPDTLLIGVPATANSLVLSEFADVSFDFAHAQQADPTLFIHSHNQNTTQWLGLTHNGTDGVISSGAGKILMTPVSASSVQITSTNAAALILNPTAGFDGLQLLGQYATIINTTTGWQIQGTGYQTQTSAIALEPGTANSVQIYEYADRTFDFAHGAQTDPTLFIHSHNQSTTQWIGLSHNGANGAISTGLGPVALASGSTVASASALPLPTGNVFHVSGTTSITSITTTALSAGMTITLIFDGTLAGSGFVDGNNLKLAGNFAANADDTITLAYDGTNFYEVARSAN